MHHDVVDDRGWGYRAFPVEVECAIGGTGYLAVLEFDDADAFGMDAHLGVVVLNAWRDAQLALLAVKFFEYRVGIVDDAVSCLPACEIDPPSAPNRGPPEETSPAMVPQLTHSLAD